MSAVMFCGLRRDVGANSVGECGTQQGNYFNKCLSGFFYFILIYYLFIGVIVALIINYVSQELPPIQ